MLDAVWIGACCLLVLAQQLGFLCLETGACRSKNNINIAIKNFIDIPIVFIFFVLFGFTLFSGESAYGLIGFSFFNSFASDDPLTLTQNMLLASFCCTCVTITSGAAAERLTFVPYLLITLVCAVFIFPVIAHWVWADLGWLKQMGAFDFAGSSVVHLAGGAVALAAIIKIGARAGRFKAEGKPNDVAKSNLVIFVVGGQILWLGWFGFNAGSLGSLTNQTFPIVLNTAISGATGALFVIAIQWIKRTPFEVDQIVNGTLAALVATSASINALNIYSSILVSVVGVLAYLTVSKWILSRQLDDAVDAVAVHAGAGFIGSMIVPLFVANTNVISQLLLVVSSFGYAFAIAYGFLYLLDKVIPLRVSGEMEFIGLNVVEHNAKSDLHDLLTNMEYHKQTGDYSTRVKPDPFVEVGAITQQYNQVLDEIVEKRHLLNHALDDARNANKAKDQFLANIRHELATPLNGVIGAARLLMNKLDCSAQDKKFLQAIISSGERLSNNFSAILDYSDLNSQQTTLTLEKTDVAQLAKDTAETYRSVAHKKGLDFDVQLDPRLPESLLIDKASIRQIISQLMQNAVDFTQSGSVTLLVNLVPEESQKNQQRILFTVKDTGSGIAEDKLEEIFKPFQQLNDGDDRSVEGLGLGLSIVQKLVNLYGGKLDIDSKFGEYNIFYVWLDFPNYNEVSSNTNESQPLAEKYPLKILIVDDNEINLTIASHMLKQWQYQPDIARNGVKAIELVRSQNYDVIFMDLQMPEMDGLQAAAKIRSDISIKQQPKIVALTANSDLSYRKKAIHVGMDGFIAKPLQAEEMVAQIKKLFTPAK
jgi:Amt family ammonium transporter